MRILTIAALAAVLTSAPAAQGITEGTIVNVDMLHNHLHVLTPDGKVFVFVRTHETIVTLDGQPLKFELLQTGWRVRVQTQGNTSIALKIDAFKL